MRSLEKQSVWRSFQCRQLQFGSQTYFTTMKQISQDKKFCGKFLNSKEFKLSNSCVASGGPGGRGPRAAPSGGRHVADKK